VMEFQAAINRKYTDKIKPGDGRFWDFNMTFENETLSLPAFVNSITAGHAWTAPHEHIRHHRPKRNKPDYHTTFRVKANVIDSQLLALDSDTEDERSSFASLLADPFIGQYAALIHASASSTWEKPRSRIVFLLDRVLNPDDYELALQALLFGYPFCDQSVKHAAAVFYGAKDCAYCFLGTILPVSVLWEKFVHPYQAHLQSENRKRAEARQRRLAEADAQITKESLSEQIAAYVTQVKEHILDELSSTSAGSGLRHSLLFESALQLGSLQSATWLTADAKSQLHTFEDDLFDAAVRNGYAADYGEDDTWRTIENGVDIGIRLPYEEPVWYSSGSSFNAGDRVTAVVNGVVVAEGQIRRFRENKEGNYWEYELESKPHIWFAKNLLRRNQGIKDGT
jgi:hypothetical protein